MAWTRYQLILAAVMVTTGSINTLAAKWADQSYAKGSDSGAARLFDHPFLQAVGMFLGELSCLATFHIMRVIHQKRGTPMDIGNQSFNPLIFLPASLCDMMGTSLMYVGLNLTYASSFQMLRGAVMIFTALLSVSFLRRIIKAYMWLGMLFVVGGLILVGVSDIIFGTETVTDKNSIISGDLLIIMAQIIAATQMVYEERFVTKHNVPPLQAVGWEGFFGFFILGILLVPMYYIKAGKPFSNDPEGRLENPLDAFAQMGNNPIIIVATVGNIVSIAFFNFAGISVTKEISATTRMVLDSLRTLVIWVVSLAVLWQPWNWKQFLVQAAGFVLLIIGMCIYNNIVCAPLLRKAGVVSDSSTEDERAPLLAEDRPVNQGDPQDVRTYSGTRGPEDETSQPSFYSG